MGYPLYTFKVNGEGLSSVAFSITFGGAKTMSSTLCVVREYEVG